MEPNKSAVVRNIVMGLGMWLHLVEGCLASMKLRVDP